MRRREFIAVLGGAAARRRGRSPRVRSSRRCRWLGSSAPHRLTCSQTAYADFLGSEGNRLCRGRKSTIAYRWAEGQFDRLPALAVELVRRQVAVIAVGATSAVFAAKAATTTVPILFIIAEDPVGLGLVASLARPGGNMTGVNLLSAEVVAKRLELLRQLIPGAARIAVLINPADAKSSESTLRDVDAAARRIGLQTQVASARTIGEIDAAFAAFAGKRPDALFLGADPFFTSRRIQLANLASRHAHSHDICHTGDYRGRRTDELWSQHSGCVASGWRLCGSHPQGREARGLAGRAGDQA